LFLNQIDWRGLPQNELARRYPVMRVSTATFLAAYFVKLHEQLVLWQSVWLPMLCFSANFRPQCWVKGQ
jgi:hypothetical protein